MPKKKYFKIDLIFFYLLLIYNLVNIWSVDIYASLDGPSHLYNSSLLNYINDSDYLNGYYVQNRFFLPNYLPHLILSKLFLLFDPFISEKIYLSIIVVFLPLSFRYAVKLLSGTEAVFSFLIFSLMFGFLFHLGFFNFSFAFIFLNCQLILAHYMLTGKNNWKVILLFIVTNLALYYTHPFVYIVSMSTIFLYAAFKLRMDIRELIRKGVLLFVVCMPTLIMFVLFMIKIPVTGANPGDKDMNNYVKLNEMVHLTPGISYSTEREIIYTTFAALIITFLLSLLITKRFLSGREKRSFYSTDVFLILAAIIMISHFFIHNASLGGMFINRLTFLFFYFLIFWLACNKIESQVVLILSMFVVVFTYSNLALYRHEVLTHLSKHARAIANSSAVIKEKSVVYSVNYSDSWLEGHSSDYAGINKEIVVSGNYEAVLGWFPLKWKWDDIFRVKCEIDTANKNLILPDYILIYGEQQRINLPENERLKKFVEKNTTVCYESGDKYCKLFKLNRPK